MWLRVLSLIIGSLLWVGTAHADREKDDYQLHCMGCHGEDGRGLGGKVPSFRSDLGRFLATPQGREFVQRVPGVSLSSLSSERLAALMNWLVREFVDPASAAKAAPFTAEELDRLRKRPLLDVAEVRAAAL